MRSFLICLFAFIMKNGYAQSSLPLLELNGSTDKPFVIMVSGDGGSKGFTVSLAQAIHDKGYTIALIDARSYFWQKKTPEETTVAIASCVAKNIATFNDRRWVMIGYSFGADITPFVVNRLPDSLRNKLITSVLISPSTSTDFEIHLADMFGIGKKRSMDVIQEINRIGNTNLSILGGDDETGFPFGKITLPHFHYELLKGDHHYDGNYGMVASKICSEIERYKL